MIKFYELAARACTVLALVLLALACIAVPSQGVWADPIITPIEEGGLELSGCLEDYNCDKNSDGTCVSAGRQCNRGGGGTATCTVPVGKSQCCCYEA